MSNGGNARSDAPYTIHVSGLCDALSWLAQPRAVEHEDGLLEDKF